MWCFINDAYLKSVRGGKFLYPCILVWSSKMLERNGCYLLLGGLFGKSCLLEV